MNDEHAYHPEGMRFREYVRDVDEMKGEESFDSRELTETLGKLRLQGKAKQIDKMKILEQMIEEEMTLRLPKNLNAYMIIFCFSIGVYAFYDDWKQYYKKLSSETYRSSKET